MKDRACIEIESVDGKENEADFFTKIYTKKEFRKAQQRLMGRLPSFLCESREPADFFPDGSTTPERTLSDIEDLGRNNATAIRMATICPP